MFDFEKGHPHYDPEHPEWKRLLEAEHREKNWQRWGPYLSERQWGTVREDYSAEGDSWRSFPHDHARSRAYRWGEDGLLGFTDRQCRLCFGLGLWNGQDAILKERLFGLTGPEGNHAEDVKELYYYLDGLPTHAYAKALYKYPHAAYPYQRILDENRSRGLHDREFELEDAGVFDEDRYFDVYAEYAKAGPDDLLIKVTVVNRGPEKAHFTLLPQLWFRNTWIWGCEHDGCTAKPRISQKGDHRVETDHESLGEFTFHADPANGEHRWLFTENETNKRLLYGNDSHTEYVKDAFHRYIIQNEKEAVNPAHRGTKTGVLYQMEMDGGETREYRFRLLKREDQPEEIFGDSFTGIFEDRLRETDEFYDRFLPKLPSEDAANIRRQAYAGLYWTKQFYHYSVHDWLKGDENEIAPPPERKKGRNKEWKSHLFNRDVISMPDKWEYPWYAAWDLAFHMIPFAEVDPDFAKQQLVLFLREWYMHPNGQIPAYEFNLGDVNPPVHAWAVWRVYKISGERGKRDLDFLERCFHKLLINFTWWVNRKDKHGRNIFAGGFLGLDNIGVFDRSKPLPTGGHLSQADGTAWMAFYCSTMLGMALELASENPAYEDVASKFFEHFIGIVDAMNTLGGTGLWDEEDGFYYDQLSINDHSIPLKVRSMVGLIPLFAVEILEDSKMEKLDGFRSRMNWFLNHRGDLAKHITYFESCHACEGRHLLAVPSKERLQRVLSYLFAEEEFLSPHGIRSLSRYHKDNPFVFEWGGERHEVGYVPGESTSYMFGGNSNWRGPIWFPVNFLLKEALERYHLFYGDELKVEIPTGSGNFVTLDQAAKEISRRASGMFLKNDNGTRSCFDHDERYARNDHFKDLLLFHEYFDGDTGRGLGASHQTGWTALVAKMLEDI